MNGGSRVISIMSNVEMATNRIGMNFSLSSKPILVPLFEKDARI